MSGGTVGVYRRIQEASLGRHKLQESSKDEALEQASGLRPRSSLRAPFAASRVRDELAALALDPAPGAPQRSCPHKPLDNADAVIDALPAFSRFGRGKPRPHSSPWKGRRGAGCCALDLGAGSRNRNLRLEIRGGKNGSQNSHCVRKKACENGPKIRDFREPLAGRE